MAVAVAVLVWVLAGFGVRAFSSGEILPGTSMSGLELGGQTREGAENAIAGLEPRTAQLSAEEQTITFRAPQAGLVVDVPRSADEAYSAGRSGILSVLQGPLAPLLKRDLEPIYAPVKQRRLTRTVRRLARQLDRVPFVGALTIDPSTLEVTTEQPESGVRVERDATRDRLLETFQEGRNTMEIPMERLAAPRLTDVEAVAADAERYLRRPLVIATAGGPARFTPQQLAGMFAIESTGERPDVRIRLGADRGAVEREVAELAQERDRPARNARVNAPPLPPVNVSEQGDLSWRPKPDAATLTKARVGRSIAQEKAVSDTIQAIRDGRHRVRFPSEPVEPDVPTSAVRGATSLLGTFTTSFSCCEPRVTNIQRIAQTVDRTVIGPGEQFSLNGIAGERTRANGYRPAPTIGEGNQLVDTVGGGVSQFSTTMYNAVYFVGLQIDAHTPHSFYISRYPPGRESTLNYGSIDLLWTNDTESPVVVRSSASDTAVTVSIYGQNGGRTVRAKTLSRRENGQGGFDITIERVIVYGDGQRKGEPYTTSYGVPAD